MGKLIVFDYATLDGVMEAPQDWLGLLWAPEVDDLSLGP